jgi:uncharacterized membrane protein YagU involved in acid resistance
VNWDSWLLWGFIATLVLLTRMNLPYMLGTLFTPDRDKAKLYGFFVHLAAGWAFSLVYVFIFEALGEAGWWRGAIIGLAHSLFVLVVIVALLPGLHPRMASELHGPEAGGLLEPPGFLALNYGLRTPVAVILSHIAFGIVLGAFYQLK